MLGSTTPRLWTPPLVELTPETSYGFDVIDFARDVLGVPLDPWQEWLVIHAGELLPDGRPRFRVVLAVVGRQNGKTLLARTLILYWLFVEQVAMVLGTSTDRSYAKRTWEDVIRSAKESPWLSRDLGPTAVRLSTGEEMFTTLARAEYTFAANNRRAGRSLTVHRWVCDELREHSNWDTWSAATNAQNAVPYAQTLCITNMGDDTSVVLDSLRDSAIEYINTGTGDSRLGLFEWSAPPGSSPTDLEALAMANPNLGRRVDPDALLGAGLRAERARGEELARFRTEVLCIRVNALDSAIDQDAWLASGTDEPLDLAPHRDKLALCVDVAYSGEHATLVAAAMVDGTVHVEVIERWEGFGCTKSLRAELPGIVARIKPRKLGWFPGGPAAAVAADLEARKGNRDWPPRRVAVDEIRGDVAAVCMGLADLVLAEEISHPKDELLDDHVRAAQKLPRGDGYVFARRGSGPIDAAYALAGAVHLARTLEKAPPRMELLK